MAMNGKLRLNLRSQRLILDASGYNIYETELKVFTVPSAQTALVLCDVWDRHWSKGANERLVRLLPRMNEAVKAARDQGRSRPVLTFLTSASAGAARSFDTLASRLDAASGAVSGSAEVST